MIKDCLLFKEAGQVLESRSVGFPTVKGIKQALVVAYNICIVRNVQRVGEELAFECHISVLSGWTLLVPRRHVQAPVYDVLL